ncbi:MAG: ATP synthase F0 subunit C [Planctomycetota bacterium]|jgi:F-type H+-transporting ATPase subunit c
MVRTVSVVLLVVMGLALVAPIALAQEPAEEPVEKPEEKAPAQESNDYLGLALGFGLSFAVIGGAFGQGKAIAAAVESMARQPEVAGKIQTAMIIGLALIETLVIYMLLICFVLGGKVVV